MATGAEDYSNVGEFGINVTVNVDAPRGVWDLDGVSQILAYDDVNGVEVTLYTVPAGKVAYLTTIHISGYNADTSAHLVGVTIYDDGDNDLAYWYLQMVETSSDKTEIAFPVPIKLSAGWYITLFSNHSQIRAYGQITAYEV